MRRRVGSWLLVIAILAFGVLSATLAEVSRDATSPSVILMSIGDDADPFPPLSWYPYRSGQQVLILNADGVAREDGRPDIAWHAVGAPVVVWAWNVGTDHDIALSEWDGTAWTEAAFLTSGLSNDLDPTVFVEPDGTVHVAWWTDGTPSAVFVMTRPAGCGWLAPVQVTGTTESGRRPSVALFDGAIRVAYERGSDVPGMSQEIVVATEQSGGTFAYEVVAATARADRLDPIIHAERGELWVDWKEDSGLVAYSVAGTEGWSAPSSVPWADPSWIGVEMTRRVVRFTVLVN